MTFMLFIDEYRTTLTVVRKREGPAASNFILLGERDPDQPIEFKIGSIYFNPLLVPAHPFIMNGDNKLLSMFNGKAVKRMSKILAAQVARGWFEVLPRPLIPSDINPEVRRLIVNTPKLTGVISQLARSTMSLRIPDDLTCSDESEWLDWFGRQMVVMTPKIRQAFAAAATRKAQAISDTDKHLLMTGQEPERQFQVLIRWVKTKTIRIYQRELYESPERHLTVPESVMAKGEEAIMEYVNTHVHVGWNELMSDVIAQEEISREDTGEESEGPLIWFRPTSSDQYAPLTNNPAMDPDRPQTFQDHIRQAMQAL